MIATGSASSADRPLLEQLAAEPIADLAKAARVRGCVL
jgi:hypothetical protein